MKLSFSKLSSPWRRLADRVSGWTRASRRSRRGQCRSPATRRLCLELLEDRTLLSASPFDLSAVQAPSLDYSALVGGYKSDFVSGIAVDSTGNVYITGYTESPTFPGTIQINAGGPDAFVSKFSPSGELLWSTLLGGDSYDYGNGIAVDSSGNAYIIGYTFSSIFPGASQAHAGDADVFVSKLNPDGRLLWTKLIGGSFYDVGEGIAVDSSGNIYITGETDSPAFPGTDQTNAGKYDTFVSKLSPSGDLLWSTLVGGSAEDFARGIAVDSSGNAYITGYTYSPTFSGTDQTRAGFADAFVSKFSSGGDLLWSRLLGGSDNDRGYGIAVDSFGNAYITGETESPTFPGADQTRAGLTDAFVSKFSSGGDLLWSTLVVGSAEDYAQGIAVDSSGNAYITGYTNSPTFPGTDQINAGDIDVFASKVSAAGELLWSKLVGGSFDERGQGIALDSLGNIYVAGRTNSTNFPGPNGAKLASAGSNDAFVIKLLSQTVIDNPGTPPPIDNPGTPPPPAGTAAAQEWNSFLGLYQLLCYQYFSKLGLDLINSFSWGSVFAQFNVNLGTAKGASPLLTLLLFNHLLSQDGDPYSSGIVAMSLTGKGGTFTPVSGSPSERAEAYYQSLGLALDSLKDLYAHALSLGHPDDAIVALIAAQHGVPLV